MAQTRRDYIPAAPIIRHIDDWCRAIGRIDGISKGGTQRDPRLRPIEILSIRMGLTESALERNILRGRQQGHLYIQFDRADAILSAMNRNDLWHRDPELAEWYEHGAKGADAIYPIAEEA